MKKSNIVLLFVIQMVALFVFSNIYTLFKPLEIKEIEAVKDKADLLADLYILKYQADLLAMRNEGFFDDISTIAGDTSTGPVNENGAVDKYVISRPLPPNRTVVFEKKIGSLILSLLQKLKKTFSTLSITLGIFLVFTSFYLAFLFKKEKGMSELKHLPPLQDYLLQLKGSEQQLRSMVVQQQESVLKQDELNKSIINNINSAIVFTNVHGKIDIFNKVAETLFDQSYANARNNSLEVILKEYPEILEFIEKAKDQAVGGELECRERVYQLDLLPIENIGRLIIAKDITEEKEQEAIDRRNKNFIMLGEMTAFLAHEIRNSLGVVYGYTKTLVGNSGSGDRAGLERKIDKVNEEINFLSNMMESFLNFSKPVKTEKKEEIDLSVLLKDMAAENDLQLEISGENTVIKNDRTLINSIFSNLFLNSREAGADRIDIDIADEEPLQILFKDNGKGIAAKNREKIWFPFFTTKAKGTGMGLAIIRKIVNSLNGDIVLVDPGSKGTTFKLTFYD